MDPTLQQQIEEVLKGKRSQDIKEYEAALAEVGRKAPCKFFTALDTVLKKNPCIAGMDMNCLTCTKYEPHEASGFLGSGWCQFECGKVTHLAEEIESDGFYRSGITLCGRFVDEETDAVEMYPGDPSTDRRICKRCKKVTLKYSGRNT